MSDAIARAIRAIYDGLATPGGCAVNLNLAATDYGMITIGPHAGFADGALVMMYDDNQPGSPPVEIPFNPGDGYVARQLAAALVAWADWQDEWEKRERTDG